MRDKAVELNLLQLLDYAWNNGILRTPNDFYNLRKLVEDFQIEKMSNVPDKNNSSPS